MSDYEYEQILQKAKIITYVSFLSGLSLAIMPISFLFADEYTLNVLGETRHLGILGGALAVVSSFACRKNIKNYRIPFFVVMTALFVIVPIRTYLSGGLFSSLSVYGGVSIVLAGLIYDKKGIIVSVLYWFAYMVFLFWQHKLGYIPPQNPVIIGYSTLFFAHSVGLASMIAYIYVATQKSYKEAINQIERKKTLKLFTAALSQEINNTLCIAQMRAELCGSNIDNLSKMKKELDRIEQIVLAVQAVEKDMSRVEVVEYVGDTEMMSFK
jgi:signal transduction histidine kinase